MYIDITEYKGITSSKNFDSIIKFWSIKSHESKVFRDYKINLSRALRFERSGKYKKSKIYFDKCYAFAKQMGDLSGIIDCISGFNRLAKKQKNLALFEETKLKLDGISEIFCDIPYKYSDLIVGAAGYIALSRIEIEYKDYIRAEFFLLKALERMLRLGYGANIAMCYRLLWNFALISSDFNKGEIWLLNSLEVFQNLGDQSAMAEMCNEVYFGGAVTSHQVLKMRKTIQSFMATTTGANPA